MAIGAAIGDPAGETIGSAISKLEIESKHVAYRPIIRMRIAAPAARLSTVFSFRFSVLET
jgi:phosphoribosylformylglycinamidine (FGAM) synthase PurS component